MSGSELSQVLLALPDLELRLGWLSERLERWSAAEAARALDDLLAAAPLAPEARESLLVVVLWVLHTRSSGDEHQLRTLRLQAEHSSLWNLERLLRRPSPGRREAGPASLPVPNYAGDRELTLGERRALARRPTRRYFERLLDDPHPMVIGVLLENPKLTEGDVLRLVARRPGRAGIIARVACAGRWLRRARIRQAILLNPGTPIWTAMPLVCLSNRAELREIMQSRDTDPALRSAAREYFSRRPPVKDVTNEPGIH